MTVDGPQVCCPHCQSQDTKLRGWFGRQIMCRSCGARGPLTFDHGGRPTQGALAAMAWSAAKPPQTFAPTRTWSYSTIPPEEY